MNNLIKIFFVFVCLAVLCEKITLGRERMNIELNQPNFEALHQRIAKLELQLRLVNLFWIVIFGILITSAWTVNKYPGEVIDNSRVRQISVLDEQCKEKNNDPALTENIVKFDR
jgi:hypothetical protein